MYPFLEKSLILSSERKRERSLCTMSRLENAHYLGTRKDLYVPAPKPTSSLTESTNNMAEMCNGPNQLIKERLNRQEQDALLSVGESRIRQNRSWF
jgi:hypothetical protein